MHSLYLEAKHGIHHPPLQQIFMQPDHSFIRHYVPRGLRAVALNMLLYSNTFSLQF